MIDVLAYELKYKNDEMVMDLLREYKTEAQKFTELEDQVSESEDFGSQYDDLKELVEDVKEEVEGVLDYIDGLTVKGEKFEEEVREQIADARGFVGKLP